jgi:hypothetical protein
MRFAVEATVAVLGFTILQVTVLSMKASLYNIYTSCHRFGVGF